MTRNRIGLRAVFLAVVAIGALGIACEESETLSSTPEEVGPERCETFDDCALRCSNHRSLHCYPRSTAYVQDRKVI